MFLYGELVEVNNLALILGSAPTTVAEVAELKGYVLVTADEDCSGITNRPLKSVHGLLWKMSEEQVSRLQSYLGATFKLKMCEVTVDKVPRAATTMVFVGHPKIYPVDITKVKMKLLAFSGLYTDDPVQQRVLEQTLNTMFPDYDIQWFARTYPYFVLWLREVGMRKEKLLDTAFKERTFEDVYECLACLFKVSPSVIKSVYEDSFIAIPMKLELACMIKRAAEVFLDKQHTSIANDFYEIVQDPRHHEDLCQMTPSIDDNPLDVFFDFVEYTRVTNDFDGQLLLLLVMDVLHMPLIPLTDMSDKLLSAWILNKIKERSDKLGRDTSTG